MELKNYIIQTYYERITSKKIQKTRIWPSTFTVFDKEEFLDNIIKHFEEIGEYEKCDKIIQMQQDGEI